MRQKLAHYALGRDAVADLQKALTGAGFHVTPSSRANAQLAVRYREGTDDEAAIAQVASTVPGAELVVRSSPAQSIWGYRQNES